MEKTIENYNRIFVDGKTVLFVDDEEKVLTSVERALHDEPYNMLFAQSAKEVLEILQQQEVHVIVTDMRMPEMNGFELLQTIKKNYPHIIRMVLSGFTDVNTLLEAINQGEIFRFIPKPWKSNEELKTIILQAIEFYELQGEREMLIQFFEMWTEGMEPQAADFTFLKQLVSSRKRHLYQWADSTLKCDTGVEK